MGQPRWLGPSSPRATLPLAGTHPRSPGALSRPARRHRWLVRWDLLGCRFPAPHTRASSWREHRTRGCRIAVMPGQLDGGSISTAGISSQAQSSTSHCPPTLLEQKVRLPLLVRLVPSVNCWEARHDTYPASLNHEGPRGITCLRHAAVTQL